MPPERLILLCGEFNKNLKQIEKALKIKILDTIEICLFLENSDCSHFLAKNQKKLKIMANISKNIDFEKNFSGKKIFKNQLIL